MRAAANVALLAEGVDRNRVQPIGAIGKHWSPSSRRAWIEISKTFAFYQSEAVALLAEGVDRN